ncbi:AmmeMemoRadiSam system protein A [Solemya velesiana gill symbiont]|uniref:AMMECR1 domain-containing protein n=1 Tax=Solemya velesiana gill symbiont TaxID=1918948 RepID=A0A1T2KVZ1_9GAMM|nr:AmmeMemoRadiSam system protein A [Solemya velesiana gill symbiont]OOZ36994.1 AMMECR1 domain-containing protein [Solemya velesiana gill symbiont]
MHSPEKIGSRLYTAGRKTLLELAEASIRHGLDTGAPLSVDARDYPGELQAERACFVTLNHSGMLRGCTGHLETIQELVKDVAENAFSAAFRDPRFPRMTPVEMDGLEIHISVLTPAVPLEFTTEQDLIAKMRPGVDGLILQEGMRRGTFLPSVWEQLPQPEHFLKHLKLKAGLPADHWSDDITIFRYETESFSAEDISA